MLQRCVCAAPTCCLRPGPSPRFLREGGLWECVRGVGEGDKACVSLPEHERRGGEGRDKVQHTWRNKYVLHDLRFISILAVDACVRRAYRKARLPFHYSCVSVCSLLTCGDGAMTG